MDRGPYIHDLVIGEISGAHSDGSQSTAGRDPIVFRHNRIQAATTTPSSSNTPAR
jgi:hypothetical protein